MRISSFLFLPFLSVLLFGCDQPDVPQRTFAWLPEGETLEVIYSAQGCGPGCSYDILFRRSPEYTATITSLRSADGSQQEEALGRVTLTREEIDGLDNLFRLYRSHPQGNCTTEEKITLIRKEKDKILSTENFADRSCATDALGEGVTTIPELVAKAGH